MLIVEDNGLMRAALLQFVAAEYPGEVIHQAADGATALVLARQHQPNVVLMDIGLPDADGIELTATIMKLLPHTRVIMVTHLTDTPFRELAQAAGAFGYVTKEKIYTDLLPLIASARRTPKRSFPDPTSCTAL